MVIKLTHLEFMLTGGVKEEITVNDGFKYAVNIRLVI
jgi:hypothetical protein